jgi:hypothetical protein
LSLQSSELYWVSKQVFEEHFDFVLFTGTDISETPANQNVVPEEGEEKKVGTRRYTLRKAVCKAYEDSSFELIAMCDGVVCFLNHN